MNKYIFHDNNLNSKQQHEIETVFGLRAEPMGDFHLLNSPIEVDLMAIRKELGCDVNALKAPFADGQVRLLVMDMDSTLISIECIDEIADMLGIKKEVSAITEAAMRGELDFESSLIKRVALLKGLPVEALQRVYDERLTLNPGAEKLIGYLQQFNIKLALVSGGFTFFTDKLKEKLGFDYTLGNTLGIEAGYLTGKVDGAIIGAQSKADLLLKLANKFTLEPRQIIAIGDGANDLLMMKEAGLSIAYHAKPTVQAQTNSQLNYSGLDAVIDLLKA